MSAPGVSPTPLRQCFGPVPPGSCEEAAHELGVIRTHELTWQLRRVSAFRNLDREQFDEVARVLRLKDVERREPILLPCREPRRVFLLLDGRVKIARTDRSTCRELIVDIVRPGELFGLPAPDADQYGDTSAVALERSLVGCMSGDDFDRLTRNAEFSAEVNRLIAERLARMTARLDELVFRDVHARLARLLLRLATEFPLDHNGATAIDVPLTQQDLADLIGSTRESANIAVNDFRRQGLIDIRRRHILIRDSDRLRRISV